MKGQIPGHQGQPDPIEKGAPRSFTPIYMVGAPETPLGPDLKPIVIGAGPLPHMEVPAKKMSHDERVLRQMVWLNHGCPFSTLYGDDGEMQCSDCGIDFLRDTPDQIRERLAEIRMKKLEGHNGLS